MAAFSNSSCPECWDLSAPPDRILTIPPPPMPTFFATSILTAENNKSNIPCPLLCDWTTGQGMEMNEELPHIGNSSAEHSWYLLTISSLSVILLLAMLTTVLLMKCRHHKKMKSRMQMKNSSGYTDRTYESILYPASMKENHNHVLWTTLNQKGKPRTIAITSVPPPLPPRGSAAEVRSFENSAFADFDEYSTRYGRPRPRVSSPRYIENPNMPPLNFYPTLKRHDFPSLL